MSDTASSPYVRPDVKAFLDFMASVPGPSMAELGPEGAFLHAECGRAAAQSGIPIIIGVRGLARYLVAAAAEAGARTHFLDTPEEAGFWLRDNLEAGDLVLLKASRGVRLERALDVLQAGTETVSVA